MLIGQFRCFIISNGFVFKREEKIVIVVRVGYSTTHENSAGTRSPEPSTTGFY